jgi:hypothetical protein
MRRFFIWSALAAVIGLILAGVGYWAYWTYYARFQPVTVSRNQGEIQRLLDEASWVSAGGGGEPLYVIGYRDSAAMQRYEREEAPKLRAAGVEVRLILFARPDREGLAQSTAAERATIAELWLTRDWTLYQRWTATPVRNWTAAGIRAADGNLARGAVVDAGRAFVARLSEKLGEEGLQARYPLIIWRDREGFMKACACTDARSWVFIRDDLDAPERIEAPGLAPGDAPPPQAYPGDGSPETLPYPTLPPLGSTPGVGPAAPSGGAPAATGRPANPAAPATPPPARKAPEPKQADDSTFF